MNKHIPTTSAGTQPIPGYTLRKRLGAGGYGEVWLADAPGGLQKAIKLIYGNVAESRATGELRSLERIRRVHHPFLLSLERIEVINGKVVIVTELAESSLQDRFETYRRQGAPGIPRGELLNFMRDTADALDFLAEKHSLQHLDVKPGNLLIIADRIKVADFGLVKDLHEVDQSLVSGLTPTYSAPEIFDGRPDFRSDQYSLAIVYMELLTGKLPFSGRTAGELARQHLQQAPDLEPLPPAERGIVQRALAKNPLDRYRNCRQFIDQLLKVRSTAVLPTESVNRSTASAESTAPPRSGTDTQNCSSSRPIHWQPAIPLEQLASQWHSARAMFLGLGGQGIRALSHLWLEMQKHVDHRFTREDYGWLAIDTSPEDLEEASRDSAHPGLPADCAVRLPIQDPQAYRGFDPEQFAPLSRRWLFNIPRSRRTEGVRPIATLSLIAHYSAVFDAVERKLVKLIQAHRADADVQSPLKIYIIASLHGGTGAALSAELGYIVRRVCAKHRFSEYRLCATLSAATTIHSPTTASLPAANAIATLSELVTLMDPLREKPDLSHRTGFATTSLCPFDWVTLVDGGLFHDPSAVAQNPCNLARLVSLDCQSLTAAALSDSRAAAVSKPLGWLRTASAASVQLGSPLSRESIAQWCLQQALQATVAYLSGARDTGGPQASQSSSSAVGQIPLTADACQEFTKRLLRELGFLQSPHQILQCHDSIARWARRLSANDEARREQLAIDLQTWSAALRKITESKVYSWRQFERIQLKVIEGIQNYADQHLPALVEQFESFSDLLGQPANMLQNVRRYLSEFGLQCLQVCQQVQTQSRRFADQVNQWQDELNHHAGGQVLDPDQFLILPPHLQRLCTHTTDALQSSMHARLQEIFDNTAGQVESPDPSTGILSAAEPEIVLPTLAELLEQVAGLVNGGCQELSISTSDLLEGQAAGQSTVSTTELERHQPPLASGGGDVFRMLVAAQAHLPILSKTISALGLADQTTMLPGTPSQGTYLLCDATNLNLPFLVTTLWRPTGSTMSLVERLRSRVDIEWEPASGLLQWKLANSDSLAPSAVPGATAGPPGVVGQPGGATEPHLATQPLAR